MKCLKVIKKYYFGDGYIKKGRVGKKKRWSIYEVSVMFNVGDFGFYYLDEVGIFRIEEGGIDVGVFIKWVKWIRW